jgi:hypothetical protein
MTIVGAIVASAGLASVLYALAILARFGQKLGAVTKMRPFYRGYYVSIGCVGLALITHLLRASVFWAPAQTIPAMLNSPVFYLFLHYLPLAVGLSIALGVTWYYWSWLLKEKR